MHKSRKSYDICLNQLLHAIIKATHGDDIDQYKTYKLYDSIRAEIGTITNTRTRLITQDEYKPALDYIKKKKWNFNIPEEYKP